MKAVRSFFVWAVALFVVLLSAAIALAVVYEEDVKKKLLGEINQQLQKTERLGQVPGHRVLRVAVL